MCWNDDSDIDFRVTEPVCNAVAKKEKLERARGDKPTKPGALVDIDTIIYSRTPIAQFRNPWLEKREDERTKRDEGVPVRPRDAPPGSDS